MEPLQLLVRGRFQAAHYLLSTLLRKIDGNDRKDRTRAHLAQMPQEIFSVSTNQLCIIFTLLPVD